VPSVVLRIGEERFAIELASVKQVFPRGEITPVPAAPEALLGVANLNGSPRSVFDLGRLLNVRSATTNAAYIVLLNGQHKWMGLAVESVEDIRRLETDKLMPVEEAAAGTRGHPAHGSAGCRVADSPGAGSLANGFTKGITEDRIAVLDGELLLQRTLPKPEARAREQKTLAGAPS
jgi:chemotaxis signal transduction protein